MTRGQDVHRRIVDSADDDPDVGRGNGNEFTVRGRDLQGRRAFVTGRRCEGQAVQGGIDRGQRTGKRHAARIVAARGDRHALGGAQDQRARIHSGAQGIGLQREPDCHLGAVDVRHRNLAGRARRKDEVLVLKRRRLLGSRDRRGVVDGRHGHRKGPRDRAVVCGAEDAIQTRILDRYRDDRGPRLVRHRRVRQRARGVRRRVAHRRIRDQARVAAEDRDLQCLRFLGAGGDTGQVHGLLRCIFLDRRRIGNGVQRRRIVHRDDVDTDRRDRIGSGSGRVVDRIGEGIAAEIVGFGHVPQLVVRQVFHRAVVQQRHDAVGGLREFEQRDLGARRIEIRQVVGQHIQRGGRGRRGVFLDVVLVRTSARADDGYHVDRHGCRRFRAAVVANGVRKAVQAEEVASGRVKDVRSAVADRDDAVGGIGHRHDRDRVDGSLERTRRVVRQDIQRVVRTHFVDFQVVVDGFRRVIHIDHRDRDRRRVLQAAAVSDRVGKRLLTEEIRRGLIADIGRRERHRAALTSWRHGHDLDRVHRFLQRPGTVIGQHVERDGAAVLGDPRKGIVDRERRIVDRRHRDGDGAHGGGARRVASGIRELLRAEEIGLGAVHDVRPAHADLHASALVGRADRRDRQRLRFIRRAGRVVGQHVEDRIHGIFGHGDGIVGDHRRIVHRRDRHGHRARRRVRGRRRGVPGLVRKGDLPVEVRGGREIDTAAGDADGRGPGGADGSHAGQRQRRDAAGRDVHGVVAQHIDRGRAGVFGHGSRVVGDRDRRQNRDGQGRSRGVVLVLPEADILQGDLGIL